MTKFFHFLVRLLLLPVVIVLIILFGAYYWLSKDFLGNQGLMLYFKFKLLGRI